MSAHHRPHDQTPDEQRSARDKRWAKETSIHWPAYAPTTEPKVRVDQDRVRGTKPTRIPSRSPGEAIG